MTDLEARSPTPITRIAPRLAPTALALALLAGCGTRAGSDVGVTPTANVCGSGTRVSSVLGGFLGPAPWVQTSNVNSQNCPYPENQNVYATCLTVTAVDRWDETGNGAVGSVYLQDTVTPTPTYAGTTLFNTNYTPPDLHVEPGDVLDVTGVYEEYPGPSSFIFAQCETLPQLAGAASFRYDGKVPAPVVIQPADLSTYDGGRKYVNMLVTVENVVIGANGKESSGRYSADVLPPSGSTWTISDQLFNLPGQYPLIQGETFTSVTGIVTYFGDYSLAPRSVADFQGGPPPPDAGAGGG